MATITPRILGKATLTSSLADIYTCPEATETRGEHILLSNGATAGSVNVTLQNNYEVTNKALTSNVATLTLDRNHILRVGESITVANVDATFNGTYTITAVTSNTISYSKTASNVTPTASGGGVTGPDTYLLNARQIGANGVLELFNVILEPGDKIRASAATTLDAQIIVFGAEKTSV